MKIALFVEDAGHLTFIERLVERTVADEGIDAEILMRNSIGGSGAVFRSLRDYVRDLSRGRDEFAEILVVAIDGNCASPRVRKRMIRQLCSNAGTGYPGRVVCAVPDPHIEVWYLADGQAVGVVTGVGTQRPLPRRKCEHDLYKRLLEESFGQAGIDPILGGAEYGAEIVDALDLASAERSQDSLAEFRADLRAAIRETARALSD